LFVSRRRRHTSSKRDWSSDVCSSDLFRLAGKFRLTLPLLYFLLTATVLNPWAAAHETLAFAILFCLLALSVISWLFSLRNALREIGRASCRERVCAGVVEGLQKT